MTFPLLKNWLAPFLSSTIGSSNANAHKSRGSGFVTIGGGTGGGASKHSRSTLHNTNCVFDIESEEHLVKAEELKMRHIQGVSGQQRGKNGIVISNEVSVTSEDRDSDKSIDKASFSGRLAYDPV